MYIKENHNMDPKNLYAIRTLLDTPQQIVITMHKNPDADALGSSLALAKFLKKKNHRVHLISPNRYPNFLSWMLHPEKVAIFEDENQATLQKHIQQANIIFCLDFSSLSRLSSMGPIVQKATATKIIIDHHRNPENFADICICNPETSATALLIYNIIIALGQESLIDTPIATCLYTGILTDTGSFQNPNTNAETHWVVAKLLEKGVDINRVNQNLYGSQSLNRLKFLAHAISHRLTVMPHEQVAYFAIPQKDFVKFNLEAGDTEGLVNYALRLKNISRAVLLTKHINAVRLSFRSIGDIAVNELAKKHFNGGGHKNAAGGISPLSLSDTINKLTRIIAEEPMVTSHA